MALQISRIASHRPNGKEDWRLACGPWMVGRVQEEIKPVGTVFGWSLTGPSVPPDLMSNRGEADTLEEAKAQIVAAMKRWSIWAGVRQANGDGPVEPRWVLAKEHEPGRSTAITSEPETYWLMLSSAFVAGRIYRPANWQGARLRWQLLTSGPMAMPDQTAGWADNTDAAKMELLAAWRRWLEWADLAAADP
jgi:hypothetical protein